MEQGSHFVYDLDALTQHGRRLAQGHARLFFACKANPLSHVLSTLHLTGVHFDVSSEGELLQVLSVGVPGKHITMTGPAKSKALFTLGLENEVSTFVIESASQLDALQTIAKDYTYEPNILIRLQLQGITQEKNVLGGAHATAFGVDIETARALMPKVKLPLLGFHVFQWNNILLADELRRVWTAAIEACQTLTEDFTVMDMGGGLGIPYNGETPLEWTEVNALIKELKHTYDIPELWLEMGRYLTGPCGTYMTRVLDRKKTYNKDILVLEGGINHLARAVLLGEFFPVSLHRETHTAKQSFELYGPLCTTLDYLGTHALPQDVHIGDVLVFHQVGAYGFTESMPFFLCHHLAGESVIQDGKVHIVRKQESAKFWLK